MDRVKLTFDWNCLIEVEERRPEALFVLDLIDRHRRGELEVALLAASASENTRSRRFPETAALFKKRILALGWQDLPLVLMPLVWGLSYWGFGYFVEDGDQFERDRDEIWKAIAPNVPRDPAAHLNGVEPVEDDEIQSEQLAKWRNTWCDVISAYSHIHEGRDVFVTNNTRDFQRNAEALAELGMKHIAKPSDAFATVEEIRLSTVMRGASPTRRPKT